MTKYVQQVAAQANIIGNLRSISFIIIYTGSNRIKIPNYLCSLLLFDQMNGKSLHFSLHFLLSVSSLFMWNLQTDPRSFKFKRQTHMSHNVCLWKENITDLLPHFGSKKNKWKMIESEICNRCTILKAVCGLIISTVCQLVTGKRTSLNLKLVESVRNMKS